MSTPRNIAQMKIEAESERRRTRIFKLEKEAKKGDMKSKVHLVSDCIIYLTQYYIPLVDDVYFGESFTDKLLFWARELGKNNNYESQVQASLALLYLDQFRKMSPVATNNPGYLDEAVIHLQHARKLQPKLPSKAEATEESKTSSPLLWHFNNLISHVLIANIRQLPDIIPTNEISLRNLEINHICRWYLEVFAAAPFAILSTHGLSNMIGHLGYRLNFLSSETNFQLAELIVKLNTLHKFSEHSHLPVQVSISNILNKAVQEKPNEFLNLFLSLTSDEERLQWLHFLNIEAIGKLESLHLSTIQANIKMTEVLDELSEYITAEYTSCISPLGAKEIRDKFFEFILTEFNNLEKKSAPHHEQPVSEEKSNAILDSLIDMPPAEFDKAPPEIKTEKLPVLSSKRAFSQVRDAIDQNKGGSENSDDRFFANQIQAVIDTINEITERRAPDFFSVKTTFETICDRAIRGLPTKTKELLQEEQQQKKKI